MAANIVPPISSQLASKPISHFMTRQVVYATPSTTVHLAMQMMLNHKVSGLIVSDDSGKCLGIYSEFDAMLQGSSQGLASPIKYTKPPTTVIATQIFRDVLITMVKLRLKRIPVVDSKKLILGIVTRHDLMKAIFEDSEKILGKK